MAVTVGLFLVVLVLMTGLVLDLGLARFDRHANQTAADLAATAAVNALDRDQPDAYRLACERAVAYFAANSPDAGPVQGTPCAAFADATFTCGTTALPPVLVLAPPYEVYVTIPVLDAALESDPRQQLNRDVDGYDPCSRVGIRVVRERDHLFAGIIGSDSSRPASDAVARTTADGTDPEYATLVVLDPNGCQVITGSGGPIKLLIENLQTATELFPGIITIDSNASECNPPGNNEYAITPNGTSGRICAGVDPAAVGAILAGTVACQVDVNVLPDTLLTEGQPEAVADMSAGGDVESGRVAPSPITRGRITRQPIDHRYNCLDDYYTPGYVDADPASGGSRQYPYDEVGSTPVGSCGQSSSRRPHIDDLIAAYAAPFSGQPGWTVITGKDACSPASTPAPYPAGNYYVDCRRTGSGPKSPFTVPNGVTFEFEGPGTIVFREGIQVNGPSGRLLVNTANAADTVVYVQSGTVDIAGGLNPPQVACDPTSSTDDYNAEFYRTFMYVEQGVTNVKGSLCWDAPRQAPYDTKDEFGNVTDNPCDDHTAGVAPPAACFQNLALWSNSAVGQGLGGGGTMYLNGIFFTPNAGRVDGDAFTLHGGPGFRLEHAQFFSYRLKLAGGSQLTMRPDPDRFEATPIVGGGLIR